MPLSQPQTNFPSRNTRSCHSANLGTSLGEYGLVAAGVLIISIGAVGLLGNNVNGLFKNMLSMNNNKTQLTASATGQAAAGQGGATSSSGLTGAGANSNNIPEAIQSATPDHSVQTAGANGATNTYAQDILNAAKQELANGTIDQAQFDLLMQLSNKGHEMAAIEKAMSTAYYSSSGTATDYTLVKVSYQGQSYNVSQLTSLLNTTKSSFIDLSNSVASSDISSNSSLYGTVSNASQNIQDISAALLNANDVYISNNAGGIGVTTSDASDAAVLVSAFGNPSGNTDQQSATICTAGQHLDVNNQCVAN